MPTQTSVSYDLTAAQEAALRKQLSDVLKALPVNLSLTPEQRQTLPKMADNTIPFVQKGLAYMGTNPEFVPPYVDPAELARDFGLSAGYLRLLALATQIVSALTDVATEAGSEAYVAVLAYYNSVQQAAKRNVPGAKDIYEDLRQRFPGGASSRSHATPPPAK